VIFSHKEDERWHNKKAFLMKIFVWRKSASRETHFGNWMTTSIRKCSDLSLKKPFVKKQKDLEEDLRLIM
jgi:hypothetical protein